MDAARGSDARGGDVAGVTTPAAGSQDSVGPDLPLTAAPAPAALPLGPRPFVGGPPFLHEHPPLATSGRTERRTPPDGGGNAWEAP